MKHLCPRMLIVTLVAAIASTGFCQHPGDLVVSPTRVLLDDRTRSGDITLVNRGTEAVRYRLTLVDMEMTDDGILQRVASSETSASSVLRLSPREVLLEPGDSQRIKVAAFFPAGTPDKELRSHLAFEPIALPKDRRQPDSQSLRLALELRSVVTIPVIARHGFLSAAASISEPTVGREKEGWFATFHLARTGNRSLRGDIFVTFVPASGGGKIQLGQVLGLPVYCPNGKRLVKVRLTREISSLGKGELTISFAEPERSRGAATARSVVELPG